MAWDFHLVYCLLETRISVVFWDWTAHCLSYESSTYSSGIGDSYSTGGGFTSDFDIILHNSNQHDQFGKIYLVFSTALALFSKMAMTLRLFQPQLLISASYHWVPDHDSRITSMHPLKFITLNHTREVKDINNNTWSNHFEVNTTLGWGIFVPEHRKRVSQTVIMFDSQDLTVIDTRGSPTIPGLSFLYWTWMEWLRGHASLLQLHHSWTPSKGNQSESIRPYSHVSSKYF
jgi:hypothetical protein